MNCGHTQVPLWSGALVFNGVGMVLALVSLLLVVYAHTVLQQISLTRTYASHPSARVCMTLSGRL